MARSAIGQYAYYVHYYAQNFIKSNKMQPTTLSQYARKKASSISNQYRSKISDQQKENYMELVSALMFRRAPLEGFTSDDLEQVKSVIIESLQHGFNQERDKNKVDWERGAISSSGSSSYRGAKRYLTNEQIKKLMKQADDIRISIAQMNKGVQRGVLDKTKLDQLEALLEQQELELQKLYQNFSTDAKFYKFFGRTAIRIDTGTSTLKRIDNINHLAKELGLMQILLTGAQGELFEKVLYAAGNMANGIAVKTIQEALFNPNITTKSLLTGDIKDNIEWKINGIPAEAWAKTAMAQNSMGTIKDGDIRYDISNRASQLKTDVAVTFPSISEGMGVTTNISAKSGNIFGKYPIGLVAGTNLWYLIQDLDFKFLRQYLNIIAEHAYFWEFFEKGSSKFAAKEAASIATIKSYRSDALLATQILGVWKAISGYTFGRYQSAAQLLVLNDTVGQKVYLLEIADIINYICNGQNLTNGTLQKYFTFEGIDYNSLWLDNRWADNVHDRMAKLLTSAHAKKISVTMRGDLIKNIKHVVV